MRRTETKTRPAKGGDTKSRLLDLAQRLIQKRGFNGFSFKDLATEIGIKTASVHYHFPSKGDLGLALMERYTRDLRVKLDELERGEPSAQKRLVRFFELYSRTQQERAICLCGSLASDLLTLPEGMEPAVKEYLELNERWLERTLTAGIEQGEFKASLPVQEAATTTLSALQGGLILCRGTQRPGEDAVLARVQRFLFKRLEA